VSPWTILVISALSAPFADDGPPAAKAKPEADPYASARERMVKRHLIERGIKDKRVLDAFRAVPRHRLLDKPSWPLAYEDSAIPIGEGQTISSPFIVAFMTEALQPKPTDKIYEVGTGSGFQAAILSRLVKEVYSVEIHKSLAERSAKDLKALGYGNIHVRHGDGYEGWPDAAPFDAIIVTCSPQDVPPPLVAQLKEGGRMVIPLGDRYNQSVYIMTKKGGKLEGKAVHPTLFVPMTGKAQAESKKGQPEKKPPGDKPAAGEEKAREASRP
jgi:protein-L-isoaspartate(D-aspartate) O-methyltransferase